MPILKFSTDALGRVIGVSSIVTPGVLSTAMLALVFNEVAHSFGVDYATLQWRNVLFFSAFSISLLYFGAAMPRIGQRRALLYGQILFVAAALTSALTSSWPLFLLAQAALGVADGLLVPAQMALIRQSFPKERWGWAFGWFHGTLAAASLIGPTLGAAVVSVGGWRTVPALVGIVQGLVLVMTVVWLRPAGPSAAPARVQMQTPSAMSIATLFLVISLLQVALGSGWPTMHTSATVGAALAFVCCEWWAHRQQRPTLVPWRSMRHIYFALALLRIFCVFLVVNGNALHLPSALRSVAGLDIAQIGFVLTVGSLLSMVAAPVLGRLADRWGDGAVLLGLLVQECSICLYLLIGTGNSLTLFVVATLLSVIGDQLFSPAQLRMAQLSVDEQERDRFMGFYMFCQFISGAFAGAVLGAALVDTDTSTISGPSFRYFIACCAGVLAIAVLSAALSYVLRQLELQRASRLSAASPSQD